MVGSVFAIVAQFFLSILQVSKPKQRISRSIWWAPIRERQYKSYRNTCEWPCPLLFSISMLHAMLNPMHVDNGVESISMQKTPIHYTDCKLYGMEWSKNQ